MCCASCGTKANDDVKLKKCGACNLVRYCGVKCQREHRPHHKRECKKCAAELHNAILFKQPESSHLGDCPICCLPLSLDVKKSITMACCSKMICRGCSYANKTREKERSLQERCPFCRHPTPKTEAEIDKSRMKRVKANDPFAICAFGTSCYYEGDYESALEYWEKSAKLGDAEAHYCLSNMFVGTNMKKAIYHWEKAAIGGHHMARHNLGCIEFENGNADRAVKHYSIAASLGLDNSLKKLRECYKKGWVSKEDFAAALRAHQAAADATKSLQREKGEECYCRKGM
jgi:hypothetical protein